MQEIRRYPPEIGRLANALFANSSRSRRIRIGAVNPVTPEDPKGRVVIVTGPRRVSIRSGLGNGGSSNFYVGATGRSEEEALSSALLARIGLRKAIAVYVAGQKKIES